MYLPERVVQRDRPSALERPRTVLLEEYPQARIYVMDSQSATVLQGLLVEEAVVLRDRGSTLEEAIDALEKIRSTGRIFFTTNDLGVPPPRRPHR